MQQRMQCVHGYSAGELLLQEEMYILNGLYTPQQQAPVSCQAQGSKHCTGPPAEAARSCALSLHTICICPFHTDARLEQ